MASDAMQAFVCLIRFLLEWPRTLRSFQIIHLTVNQTTFSTFRKDLCSAFDICDGLIDKQSLHSRIRKWILESSLMFSVRGNQSSRACVEDVAVWTGTCRRHDSTTIPHEQVVQQVRWLMATNVQVVHLVLQQLSYVYLISEWHNNVINISTCRHAVLWTRQRRTSPLVWRCTTC